MVKAQEATQDAEARAVASEETLTTTKTEMDLVRAELSSQIAEKAKLEASVEEALAGHKAATARIAEEQSRVQQLQEAIQNQEVLVAKLQAENDTLREGIARDEARHVEEVQAEMLTITSLVQQKLELQAAFDSLEEELRADRDWIEVLEEEAECDAVSVRMQDVSKAIQEATVAAHAAQGTVRDELKSSALSLVRHIFVRIIKGHLAAAVVQWRLAATRATLTTGTSSVLALQDKVAALEGEREELQADVQALLTEVESVAASSQERLQMAAQTVEQLEKELADEILCEMDEVDACMDEL